MEIHFYEACKRSLFCPFSLIAFEDDQVVGLLLCSSRNHQPRKQTEPFSLKSNYDLGESFFANYLKILTVIFSYRIRTLLASQRKPCEGV